MFFNPRPRRSERVVVCSRLNDRGTLSEYSENGGTLKGHLSENALGHFRSRATGVLFRRSLTPGGRRALEIQREALADLGCVRVRAAIDSAMRAPTPIAMALTGVLRNTAAE
jgi:hypothetical protein